MNPNWNELQSLHVTSQNNDKRTQVRPDPRMAGWSMFWGWLLCLGGFVHAQDLTDPMPVTSQRFMAWSLNETEAKVQGNRVELSWANQPPINGLRLPRLAATIRSIGWVGMEVPTVSLSPEPNEWILKWDGEVPGAAKLVVVFDQPPRPMDSARRCMASADGTFWLPAHEARTVGKNLRFEPQPYKNTIGYWTNAADHAYWDVAVESPGRYAVAILVGCGEGQGGSEAYVSFANVESGGGAAAESANALPQSLTFTVAETGHFQNFRWVTLGFWEAPSAGNYRVQVGARRLAKAALMDVRAVHLVRQAR